LASGGTVGSRWPEGLRRQRSNETRHHPERGAANSRRVHICLSRRSMTRRLANPRGSPCHRCPAFASFPPSRPRASGRAPRDPGLPFRPKPEEFNDERPGRHKKTLRSSAREGPFVRIFDLVSDEIAPMSRAGARERRMAVQIFDCQVASGPHGATRIRRRGPSPNEAGL
jgi:hypothetical protein